jgi:hypothetical protein
MVVTNGGKIRQIDNDSKIVLIAVDVDIEKVANMEYIVLTQLNVS